MSLRDELTVDLRAPKISVSSPNDKSSMLDAPQDTLFSEVSTDAAEVASLPSAASPLTLGITSLLGASMLSACGVSDGQDDATASGVQSDTDAGVNSFGVNKAAGYRPVGAIFNGSVYTAPGFNNYPIANTSNDAARFLLQSQLSVSDVDIAAVKSSTFSEYLQLQFAKPIGQTGWDWLESRGYGVANEHYYMFRDYPADFMIWNQLFTSQDSMRKRVALALSEFFVVSIHECLWPSHAITQYWDVLVKNAFGNFRQLLEDITLNPAMGSYLNTKGNKKENPSTGRLPDENYGREIMQLFTIGLYQLNLDGTIKTDANGKKLETYTQSDVTNIARVFTGYNWDNAIGKNSVDAGGGWMVDSKESARRPMVLDPNLHSTLAATFLGQTIPAGTSGSTALTTTLDLLFNHPNVGPFFGKQMIQRFVTSNPSPAYVARVAAAFNDNGHGVRGDLKAVWTAIFLDDEARHTLTSEPGPSPAKGISTDENIFKPQYESHLRLEVNDFAFGKLREPMLRFVQWGRTFKIQSAANSWKYFDTTNASNQLGQSPLRAPSVFNYFRPGFVPPNTAMAGLQSPAPEFQIVNETSVAGYLNFIHWPIRYGMYCPEPSVPHAAWVNYVPDIQPDYSQELVLAHNPSALIARLNLLLCAGQLSTENQTTMINALATIQIGSNNPVVVEAQKLDRVAAAILMIMSSSDYLIQK